ncbi:hypothetical protein CH75_08815 [Dyella jiangningensis]|nr:hypothetical protein CH75_08815 [Dyella jiangningensis]
MNRQIDDSGFVQVPQPWLQISRPATQMTLGWVTESLRYMGDLQKQLLAFQNERVEKDAALLEKFVECTSPGALLDLQAELLTGLVADYAMLGQRLFAQFGDSAQRQWQLATQRLSLRE